MSLDAVKSWSVEDVVDLFTSLNLDKHTDGLRSEEIDGTVLVYLIQKDGLGELGLSRLQEAKVLKKLQAAAPVMTGKADEAAGLGAAERAGRETEKQAHKEEAEERAKREAEKEMARCEAEKEKARRETEERAKRQVEKEKARREAEEQETARRLAEEKEAEDRAKREAEEEKAMREAEERAKRQIEEEKARQEAEELERLSEEKRSRKDQAEKLDGAKRNEARELAKRLVEARKGALAKREVDEKAVEKILQTMNEEASMPREQKQAYSGMIFQKAKRMAEEQVQQALYDVQVEEEMLDAWWREGAAAEVARRKRVEDPRKKQQQQDTGRRVKAAAKAEVVVADEPDEQDEREENAKAAREKRKKRLETERRLKQQEEERTRSNNLEMKRLHEVHGKPTEQNMKEWLQLEMSREVVTRRVEHPQPVEEDEESARQRAKERTYKDIAKAEEERERQKARALKQEQEAKTKRQAAATGMRVKRFVDEVGFHAAANQCLYNVDFDGEPEVGFHAAADQCLYNVDFDGEAEAPSQKPRDKMYKAQQLRKAKRKQAPETQAVLERAAENSRVEQEVGEEALFAAVRRGVVSEVSQMLALRAQPDSVSPGGLRPLDIAVQTRDHSILALLLFAKADAQQIVVPPFVDDVMNELLTCNLESMALRSPYHFHNRSQAWRDARRQLQCASTQLDTCVRLENAPEHVKNRHQKQLEEASCPAKGSEDESELWPLAESQEFWGAKVSRAWRQTYNGEA